MFLASPKISWIFTEGFSLWLGWNASISPICAISEIKSLFRSQTLHHSSLLEFLESCPMNVKPQICQEPNFVFLNSCSIAFFFLVPYFQNFSQFGSSVSSALCDWLHFTFISGRLDYARKTTRVNMGLNWVHLFTQGLNHVFFSSSIWKHFFF